MEKQHHHGRAKPRCRHPRRKHVLPCWLRSHVGSSDCSHGHVGRLIRAAQRSTHTPTRWVQYDPMLLQSMVSQALPCWAAHGVHDVRRVCRAMLRFLGHRRVLRSRLRPWKVCCVPSMLLSPAAVTLQLGLLCARFPAHECSAVMRVGAQARRNCFSDVTRSCEKGASHRAEG